MKKQNKTEYCKCCNRMLNKDDICKTSNKINLCRDCYNSDIYGMYGD